MLILPKPGLIKNKLLKKNRLNNLSWTVSEIEKVLYNYDFKSWKILTYLGGGNSDNLLIQTEKGKKIIKR